MQAEILYPLPPPQPSSSQRWVKAAEGNDDVADMLVFAGRWDSWFDVYKALELAKRLAGVQKTRGGNKDALKKLIGTPAYNRFDHVWQTANTFRHARYTNAPAVPATPAEAREVLATVIRAVLK
jgi:hypothetical protein